MNKSISTIKAPEFINLQPLDINPLMSSCEIKVLYIGQNRNCSYISKEVAADMAKTLRGSPIVGYFKKETDDFRDHGEQIVMDDAGIHFNCLTIPYGFVSPNAEVWFQEFEDTDDFGNVVTREYLMTTGYLWTGQFPEIKEAVDNGRPQSMELDENSLSGKWSTDSKTGIEFFIINDSTFSKLCILGEDVEPCFEGASIQTTFSKELDNNFKHTLFSMMKDLQEVIGKGGNQMENLNTTVDKNDIIVNENIQENIEQAESPVEEVSAEDNATIENSDNTEDTVETTESTAAEQSEDSTADTTDTVEVPTETTYTEAQVQAIKNEAADKYSKLSADYEALSQEVNELREFKLAIDNQKKDELINSFYMLSDTDKADVIENKTKYSYDEIEAKLAVICVRNKVNFNEQTSSEHEQPVMTFSCEETDNVPAWLKAVQRTQAKNK